MAYRWRPSKTQKNEFAKQMNEIEEFCIEHGIHASNDMSSYYFTIDGKKYRVSNHTVEASNAGAYAWDGTKKRELYHPGGREDDTIYIFASKTRLIEVYNNILSGKPIDGRGRIKW